MSLIVRVDVDRPYGRTPLIRHVLSRVAADFWFPRFSGIGYLRELEKLLDLLQRRNAKGHFFIRRCTLPPPTLCRRMRAEGHVIGLHLEDSRSRETFLKEKKWLERQLGESVCAFSKHGSGRHKYGWHHHAPYEPDRYTEWAQEVGMKVFLGNLEDPTLPGRVEEDGLVVFPSAFWLEPHWRNTRAFPVGWLLTEARERDVVLLLHPDNVLACPKLTGDLDSLLCHLGTKLLAPPVSIA